MAQPTLKTLKNGATAAFFDDAGNMVEESDPKATHVRIVGTDGSIIFGVKPKPESKKQ